MVKGLAYRVLALPGREGCRTMLCGASMLMRTAWLGQARLLPNDGGDSKDIAGLCKRAVCSLRLR